MKDVIKKRLGILFENEELLKKAFRHSSYANERNVESNERLEFLGDAVLELVVSDYLYHNFLQWTEGELTRFRAQLVCEQSLSTLAKDCGFHKLLLLGKGAESSGGRNRPAILCDVFEAFVGALYLDRGFQIAQQFILSQLRPIIEEKKETQLFKDYKTLLQERLQKDGAVQIVYTVIDEKGPAHDKEFTASVSLNGAVIGVGVGKNKKSAEQQAAKMAYGERTCI